MRDGPAEDRFPRRCTSSQRFVLSRRCDDVVTNFVTTSYFTRASSHTQKTRALSKITLRNLFAQPPQRARGTARAQAHAYNTGQACTARRGEVAVVDAAQAEGSIEAAGKQENRPPAQHNTATATHTRDRPRAKARVGERRGNETATRRERTKFATALLARALSATGCPHKNSK